MAWFSRTGSWWSTWRIQWGAMWPSAHCPHRWGSSCCMSASMCTGSTSCAPTCVRWACCRLERGITRPRSRFVSHRVSAKMLAYLCERKHANEMSARLDIDGAPFSGAETGFFINWKCKQSVVLSILCEPALMSPPPALWRHLGLVPGVWQQCNCPPPHRNRPLLLWHEKCVDMRHCTEALNRDWCSWHVLLCVLSGMLPVTCTVFCGCLWPLYATISVQQWVRCVFPGVRLSPQGGESDRHNWPAVWPACWSRNSDAVSPAQLQWPEDILASAAVDFPQHPSGYAHKVPSTPLWVCSQGSLSTPLGMLTRFPQHPPPRYAHKVPSTPGLGMLTRFPQHPSGYAYHVLVI